MGSSHRNAALHAAVLANPDDDGPRTVYADWLIERGDPRGEYIALQLAGGTSTGHVVRELEVTRNLAAWNAPYGSAVVAYRRGFVEMIACDVAGLRALRGKLADACVRELRVSGDGEDAVQALAAVAPDMRLVALHFDRVALPGRAWRRLLATPALRDVATLAISRCDLEPEHVEALRAVPLRDLALTGASGRVLRALASIAPRLRSLDASSARDPLSGGALGEVLAPFDAIERLDLARAGVDDEGVAWLVGSRLPLRELVLDNCPVGLAGARRIAGEPRFRALTRLGLAHTRIGPDGVATLVASPHLDRDLALELDGELLGMRRDAWDHEVTWSGPISPPIAARFPRISRRG